MAEIFGEKSGNELFVSNLPDVIRGHGRRLGAILSVGFLFEVTNQPAKFGSVHLKTLKRLTGTRKLIENGTWSFFDGSNVFFTNS